MTLEFRIQVEAYIPSEEARQNKKEVGCVLRETPEGSGSVYLNGRELSREGVYALCGKGGHKK